MSTHARRRRTPRPGGLTLLLVLLVMVGGAFLANGADDRSLRPLIGYAALSLAALGLVVAFWQRRTHDEIESLRVAREADRRRFRAAIADIHARSMATLRALVGVEGELAEARAQLAEWGRHFADGKPWVPPVVGAAVPVVLPSVDLLPAAAPAPEPAMVPVPLEPVAATAPLFLPVAPPTVLVMGLVEPTAEPEPDPDPLRAAIPAPLPFATPPAPPGPPGPPAQRQPDHEHVRLSLPLVPGESIDGRRGA